MSRKYLIAINAMTIKTIMSIIENMIPKGSDIVLCPFFPFLSKFFFISPLLSALLIIEDGKIYKSILGNFFMEYKNIVRTGIYAAALALALSFCLSGCYDPNQHRKIVRRETSHLENTTNSFYTSSADGKEVAIY